jgi:hypothetical protein
MYLCNYVLRTEMHVGGNSGILFENKSKSTNFTKKIYINFNVTAKNCVV